VPLAEARVPPKGAMRAQGWMRRDAKPVSGSLVPIELVAATPIAPGHLRELPKGPAQPAACSHCPTCYHAAMAPLTVA